MSWEKSPISSARKENAEKQEERHTTSLPAQQRLGKQMQKIRLQRCLTQDEVAYRAQVHRNYYSDVERGRRNVSIGIIERIADALEVDIAELFK